MKLTNAEKLEVLKGAKRCFKCFGAHHRNTCTACNCSCGRPHHKLLCRQTSSDVETSADDNKSTHFESYLVDTGTIALHPICPAYVKGYSKPITVFMDGGSNAST